MTLLVVLVTGLNLGLSFVDIGTFWTLRGLSSRFLRGPHNEGQQSLRWIFRLLHGIALIFLFKMKEHTLLALVAVTILMVAVFHRMQQKACPMGVALFPCFNSATKRFVSRSGRAGFLFV